MRCGRCVGFAVGVLFLTCAVSANAGEQPDQRTITVNGRADVNVVPDQVVIYAAVETRDAQLTAAMQSNDKSVQRVLQLALEHAVDEKDIQTDRLSIQPWYKHYSENQEQLGFIVRKNIAIVLKEIDQFEALLSGLIEAGVSHIDNIRFRTSQLREYKDEARTLALKAAKEKATAMAAVLGEKIARPTEIIERNSQSGWLANRDANFASNDFMNAPGAADSYSPTISLGQISVTAEVRVTFALADAPE